MNRNGYSKNGHGSAVANPKPDAVPATSSAVADPKPDADPATSNVEPTSPIQPEFLTAPQVAKLLGISRATLYREKSAGRFPPGVPISAGRVVWPRETIDAFLKDKRAEHDAWVAKNLAPRAR